MKKASVVALVLLLLIPLVLGLGGVLFSVINPEVAAGHANYARNFHLLTLLKDLCFFGSLAVVGVMWMAVWLLVIRSKRRSQWWMLLALLGPVGFAFLCMLNDREPAETDRYGRFVRGLNRPMRAAWEAFVFASVWVLAYEGMVLNRMLMMWFEAKRTGVSTAQIMAVQNASGGMWAFAEGNEVMYLVVLLYLAWPAVFSMVAARMTPAAAG